MAGATAFEPTAAQNLHAMATREPRRNAMIHASVGPAGRRGSAYDT